MRSSSVGDSRAVLVTGVEVTPDGTTEPGSTTTVEPTTPAPQPTAPPPAETAIPTPTPSVAPVPSQTQGADPTEGATTVPSSRPSSPAPTPTQTAVQVPWGRDPAVTTSTIPFAAILTAALVLVLAAAALVLLMRRYRTPRPTGAIAAAALEPAATTTGIGVLDESRAVAVPGAAPADTVATVRFLMVLGQAMIDSSAPVVQVTRTLERVAAINGAPDVEVIALPTALLVSVPGRTSVQTAASSAGWRSLRLHQVQDVLAVADDAESGRVGPVEGAERIEAAISAPPLYGGAVRVAGYVAVSAGLAMILGGSLLDTLVAAVLGAVIAGLQVATARLPAAYQALVVLSCAFVVAAAVFALSRTGLDVGTLAPLAAPLVTFLPGALLTTAAIDLATRQMIAGAARLAAGTMQLVLLALGVTGAAALVGVPASGVGAAAPGPLGWAGPWVGVLVYGTGVVFYYSARRAALPWIVLVLVVAYAGQVIGGVFFGGVMSAFVGALLMTPVAMFAATRPSGPPALVGFLPAFWLLVPGALGLVGVTSILGDDTRALSTVVTAGTTMVAISLGVLAGIALGSAIGRRTGLAVTRL
ncbi:threonine/serine ThrE exporter family protein [Cellulomonas fengjieae]|uniref:threonine/serine ThrE exporter family protein n=1 Tax=Cellulomonas fengjieae TaxID=2819978 RepID=UPI001AAF8A72|nr:threonine/serine exporter family protein [Cellulomonas fengjieae]MBO3101476.1 threonine/serine exporter family protein [Cellulomonas fengjieae]